MKNHESNIKFMEGIFADDFVAWAIQKLPAYLDTHFESWLINPIDDVAVEVFISGVDDDDVEERLFEESVCIGSYFLNDSLNDNKIEDDYHTELLPDFLSEYLYVYPLEELGDEPFTDNLIFKL